VRVGVVHVVGDAVGARDGLRDGVVKAHGFGDGHRLVFSERICDRIGVGERCGERDRERVLEREFVRKRERAADGERDGDGLGARERVGRINRAATADVVDVAEGFAVADAVCDGQR